MKITLVYPCIAQIGFNSFGKGTPSTNLISLGLGYIGSSIKMNTDYQVDLIDLRKMYNWDHFKRELKERSCDIVGIYANTVNLDYVIECAKIAKDMGKIVISGGPHATLAPEELLKTGYFDHVVVGEGELAIVDILNGLEKGVDIDKVVYGKPVGNLDELPFPDRDLFNLKDRLNLTGIFPFPPRYGGIISSRGCLYNCAFCQPLERKIFGKKVKFRSIENVIAEVKLLKERYQVKFIMFQDDQLTQNKGWVIDLCKEMKGLEIKWGALARVDTIDKEIIQNMKEAGCIVLQFGFESGSQRILNFLRKGSKVEQAIEASKLCREAGIMIFANYMLGIPTETEKDLEATYNLMKEINPEIHATGYFSPIPGSDLYDYCKENDLINVTSYDMYVRGTVDNKIKGIDYQLVGRFKERITKYSPTWYSERHYASCVLNRWAGLIKQGHIIQAIKEVITQTPFLDSSFKKLSLR